MSLIGFVLQWISNVAVLLLVSALVAEDQPVRGVKHGSVGERHVHIDMVHSWSGPYYRCCGVESNILNCNVLLIFPAASA